MTKKYFYHFWLSSLFDNYDKIWELLYRIRLAKLNEYNAICGYFKQSIHHDGQLIIPENTKLFLFDRNNYREYPIYFYLYISYIVFLSCLFIYLSISK